MKYLLLLAFASISLSQFAQVTNLGSPVGWNGKLNSKNIPTETMSGFDQELIKSQDEVNDITKDSPWRFGYKYEVDFNLDNSGEWTVLPNGDKLWQIAIECKSALTINLLFEDFSLPKGAYLYMYDIDKTNRVGAYTQRNNRLDGHLGTELVHGEKIIVEYLEPANAIKKGKFTIANVIHGYRSIGPIQDSLSRALNSSGDCNIDVNCPLGDGWDNEIRSVALIVVGGSGICTGALINNTCDDGTPYFLTANHCLGGGTGSWAFRFNWQSPEGTESCATTANSVDPGQPYDQTANGATTLASGTAADFALLELDNMTLSDAQNWNCFYAGWDATDLTNVTEATGIHHPSGDVKKICREDDSPYHSSAAGAAVWYIDQWEDGVTEPGSSGSPLFDQNHRIIGQLYGGAAACSGTVNNGQYDYYGRIGVAWNNGVDAFLAPNSCGETTTNDGWDPNSPTLPDDAGISGISSPSGAYCVDNFDPEITLRNYGTNNLSSVTINYGIDGVNDNTYNWTGNMIPGSTETITFSNFTTSSGAHTFTAYTSLPNGNSDSNPDNNNKNSNYTATIGGQDILVEINTDCWGSEITWSIVDENSNTMATGGPYGDVSGGEYFSENICLAVGCYDFIIDDGYGDGMYGSQWGSCDVDGDYSIVDVSSELILAEVIADNADYGDQEINNFCVTSPCPWTVSTSNTEEACFGDGDGAINVNVSDSTTAFTYDIGFGIQSSGLFNDLQQGNYSIEISDGSCSSITPVVLTGPELVSGIVTVNDISCFGGEDDGFITIEGTGGDGSYSYDFGSGYTSNGVLTGLGQGTYSVDIQDGSGCFGAVNAEVGESTLISFNQNVTAETYGNDGAINITVSGGVPPYNFNWTGPLGFNSDQEDISDLVGGIYSLIITDDNDCMNESSDVTVDSYLGFNEKESDLFTIYPNPSKGQFNILFTKPTSINYVVKVFDLTGRVVFNSSFKDHNVLNIDISDKSDGTYFLKLFDGDKHYFNKIIINK